MSICLSLAFIPVLLLCIGTVDATQKCNAVNFGTRGVLPCAMSWLNSTRTATNDSISPNMTFIVTRVLQRFNITVSMPEVAEIIPLIEVAAMAEPYLVYLFADLVRGSNLTVNESDKLNLPRSLLNVTVLQDLYAKYFNLSCREHRTILAPVEECVANWAKINCNQKLDGLDKVEEFNEHMGNYYCEGNKTKSLLKRWLNDSLGAVLPPVARYFGVVKDRMSPFLFNLSNSSLVVQGEHMEHLGKFFMINCHYLWPSLQKVSSWFEPTSNVGFGHVGEELLELGQKFARCAMRSIAEFDPQFFSVHNRSLQHLRFMAGRYGLDLSMEKESFSKDRLTAAVFGGSHVWSFGEQKTMTCSRRNKTWTRLLENKYFSLYANYPRSGEYVAEVSLKLHRGNNSTDYYSGSGAISRMFNTIVNGTASSSHLENLQNRVVRITDRQSGTVFVFTKYRESYLLFVRAGKEIQENSVGLQESGCMERTNIFPFITQNPNRGKCQKACTTAPKELVNNCVYDCCMVNDIKVVDLYKRLAELKNLALVKDKEIQNFLP